MSVYQKLLQTDDSSSLSSKMYSHVFFETQFVLTATGNWKSLFTT